MTSTAAAIEDDSWVYPDRPKYQHYVANLMSFLHGRIDDPYPKTIQHSKQELLEIKPSDIKRWLAFRAHGDPYPKESDNPTMERSASLLKAKHAVSVFMPNRHVKWMEGIGGNPTQHVSITQFIGDVERKETRGQGVKANDKRAYREAEFFMVLQLFREEEDFDHRWKYPTMTLWSHHLIHRLDDSCHFKVNDPHGCHAWPFALMTKTKWSKNVKTQQQCPDQIILGSGEWKSCTVMALANYLEMWLGMNPNALHLFTTDERLGKNGQPLGPLNVNKQYANRIKTVVWNKEAFKDLEDEVGEHNGVGTCSNRKHAADRADKQGAQLHQVEHRGRWTGEKGGRVVKKHCISSDDPYTDAYVASLLCDGGPMRYKLQEGLDVNDNWLCTEVIPNVKERFGTDLRLCHVLALARLWSVFDDNASQLLPEVDVARIRHSFQGGPDLVGNPVLKTSLEILRVGGRLQTIDASAQQQQQQGAAAAAAQMLRGADTTQLLAYIQRMETRHDQQLQAIRSEQLAFRQWAAEQFQLVISNQRRFGGTIQQSMSRGHPQHQQRRRRHAGAQHEQQLQEQQQQQQRIVNPRAAPLPQRNVDRNAKLHPRIQTLSDLWEEYQFGIGDNKPAKSFSSQEKNAKKTKQTHYRRSKVWKLQCYLINAGYSIFEANARIADVYNSTKPTSIILQITRDQKNQSYNFVGSQRIYPRLYANPN